MTNEEFWFAEPRLVESYRKALEIRNDIVNQQLWLQGLYNMDAFSVVVSNAFGGKGMKKQKYMDKPLELKPQVAVSPEEEKENAKQKVIDQLNAWKQAWDARRTANGN